MVTINKRHVLARAGKLPDEQRRLLDGLPADFQVSMVLRDLRLARGLTLEQLGAAMGTTQETALRLEHGRLPLNYKWLLLAAWALEAEPLDLFGAETLTESERRLLHLYRALRRGDRNRLVSIAEAFAGPDEEERRNAS